MPRSAVLAALPLAPLLLPTNIPIIFCYSDRVGGGIQGHCARQPGYHTKSGQTSGQTPQAVDRAKIITGQQGDPYEDNDVQSGVVGNEVADHRAKEAVCIGELMHRPRIVTPAGIKQIYRPFKQSKL